MSARAPETFSEAFDRVMKPSVFGWLHHWWRTVTRFRTFESRLHDFSLEAAEATRTAESARTRAGHVMRHAMLRRNAKNDRRVQARVWCIPPDGDRRLGERRKA